jgi:hypothetical protein
MLLNNGQHSIIMHYESYSQQNKVEAKQRIHGIATSTADRHQLMFNTIQIRSASNVHQVKEQTVNFL